MNSIQRSFEDFKQLRRAVAEAGLPAPAAELRDEGWALEEYLWELLRQSAGKKQLGPVHRFLQVSALNFFFSGQLFLQCEAAKKTGGQFKAGCCARLWKACCKAWVRRWFSVATEGISYAPTHLATQRGASDRMFFDASLRLEVGRAASGERFGARQ